MVVNIHALNLVNKWPHLSTEQKIDLSKKCGIPWLRNLCRVLLRNTVVEAHVKFEPYLERKPCRLINARVDWAKCEFGPLFSEIEHQVCKLPWFIKYTPVCDRPRAIYDRLDCDGTPITVTDYTSFEAHFEPDVMWAVEEPLYKFMLSRLPDDERLAFLLLWKGVVSGVNTIEFRGMFKVFCEGIRMSGEMNTSLGNGWSNLVFYFFAMHENGASWDEIFSAKGFVEGDDGIFQVKDELTPTTTQMKRYGLELKIEGISGELSEASFCGQIFDPQELINVADPIVILMKLAWLPRKYINCSDSTRLELLKAKAQSFLHLYNGCPIITPVCDHILKQLSHVKYTHRCHQFFDQYKHEIFKQSFGVAARPVGPRTRHLVHKLFDLSIETQDKIVNTILNCKFVNNSFEPFRLDFLPERYDTYAKAYEDYVDFPTEPDLEVRRDYWMFLANIYQSSSNVLPQPSWDSL